MAKEMAMEPWLPLTVIFTKVNGKMVKNMEMEPILKKQPIHIIKATGNKVKNKEKAY